MNALLTGGRNPSAADQRNNLLCPAVERLAGEHDAFFQNVECDIDLWLGDDQRGAQSYRAISATEQKQAAFEGKGYDVVAHLARLGATALVLDELDADHEAAPANIADGLMLIDPGAEPSQRRCSYGSGVVDSLTFKDVHGGER